jgi:PD-(D/E)XK nuclease superfamily protein
MDPDALPWDSPKLAEKNDNAWTAGCRALQSWWRYKEGYAAGELSQAIERPVASMLPLGTKPERNFYGEKVVRAMDERILNGTDIPMATLDKLFRDLLSSQTAITNLLGEFFLTPDELLPWIHTIDPDATTVTEIRFLWAPKKKLAVGGGAPFSAFVDYYAGSSFRFLAVDAVYAEDLAESKISVRPTYVEYTEASAVWRDGASRRLDRPNLRPFWLNAMLCQSLVEKDNYDSGRLVVMAVASDPEAHVAAEVVRGELYDESLVVWSPMDDAVDALAPTRPEWADWFRTRYLDFTPVAHLLENNDPRRPKQNKAVRVDVSGLSALAKIGPRVTGDGGAIEKLLKRITAGKVDQRVVSALDDRAHELAVDLQAFRDAIDGMK